MRRISLKKMRGIVNTTTDRVEWVDDTGGGISSLFETVSANLSTYDYTLDYNGSGDITPIVYSNAATKAFNYTGTDITSIILSGSTPSGIELTKTLSYTGTDVTDIV